LTRTRSLIVLTATLAACTAGESDTTVAPPDCGTCGDGTTCGTANDVAVCRDTATQIPAFEHVFVIVMENTSSDTLLNSTNTPYIHSLIADGAYAADFHGVEHPSLPNYLAMMSGSVEDNGALDCDCEPEGDVCEDSNCTILSHSCGCPQTQHGQFVDQLEAAGVTWRAYAEDSGTPCNLVGADDYAPKHVPFLYFPSLTNDTARCADHVVDYSAFAGDLAAGARRFTFIVPNLVHDMHDPAIANDANRAHGEAWLAQEVPAILATPEYTDRGLLIIVWDEDDLSGILAPDDPIPMILMSPLANHGGFTSTIRYDHYSLLATLEDAFGVDRLGSAATAAPLTDFFAAQ
jgi:hypothetical protein